MNSSGSSGMTRTSSEESEVSSVVSADLLQRDEECTSSADNDFEFNSIMTTSQPKSNPFGFGGGSSKTARKPDPTSYVAIAAAGVNRVAELLRRLQAAETELISMDRDACYKQEQNTTDASKDRELVKETLHEIGGLRQRTLCQVPVRHRQRLVDSVERSASSADASTPLTEFTSLFGRCFNLSMNLKILAGNGCSGSSMDSTLATRILSDLRVIDTSMNERLERREVMRSDQLVGALMTDMKLERTATMGGL